jgi:hypothetical protein
MGFIDYARSHSFEKDTLRLKIILDHLLQYPELRQEIDGFTVVLPTPKSDDVRLSYLGYSFPFDNRSKLEVARLFRTSVYHLTAHSVKSNFHDFNRWIRGKNRSLCSFITSLVEDMMVNAYITSWYPDRINDLGNVASMSLIRMRDISRVSVKSTRLLTSLHLYANTGLTVYSKEDLDVLPPLFGVLEKYRITLEDALKDEDHDIREKKLTVADRIYDSLIRHGPIVEVPSLPYTESRGSTTIFPEVWIPEIPDVDILAASCIEGLGGSPMEGDQASQRKVAESQALQVFESHIIEQEKEKKIHSKYEDSLFMSRFKELRFPRQDFTEFLRVKNRCKKEIIKLTERLLIARNAALEDTRKLYGVLDLSDAIQVIASKSERSDVFMREENMVKNYSWAIIVDCSRSMKHIRDFTLRSTIILTEAANKVLLDQYSWGIYAFNENLYVIKDFSEPYNTRTRSRLGGLEFEGATYLPDAIEVLGEAFRKRAEDIKILFLISDGEPFGYSNIFMVASEIISQIQSEELVVIGIGAQSNAVEYIFDDHISSFDLKDYVDQLGRLYLAKSDEV